MKILNRLLTLLPMIFLAGCMTARDSAELPASHPASPRAEQSQFAPASPLLMAGSDVLLPAVSTNGAGVRDEHDHSTHAKPAKKPAEHAHEKDKEKK